jgi:hypothetical protein
MSPPLCLSPPPSSAVPLSSHPPLLQFFATYEWCLTPLYDPKNETHRLIKKKIEEGDGLPDMATQEECVQALRDVGFEVPSHPPPTPTRGATMRDPHDEEIYQLCYRSDRALTTSEHLKILTTAEWISHLSSLLLPPPSSRPEIWTSV